MQILQEQKSVLLSKPLPNTPVLSYQNAEIRSAKGINNDPALAEENSRLEFKPP